VNLPSPIVSVVMSVFNGERFLREAVESILEQSFREFEFIIVDDGSTDQSASILQSYQSNDARVKIYRKEHTGLIESLNLGCALAQSKYIARMDADDIASKDRLKTQVAFMDAHPETGVVGGAVEWIDASGNSLGIHRYPASDQEIKATLLDGCAFWHPTVVIRREAFVLARGYRSVAVDAEDYDLWLRIAVQFQLANLEAVVLKYRIHPSQVSMRKTAQQTLSMLAVQAAASSRRNGFPDPLDAVKTVTSEALVAMGVTKARQKNRLASYRRDWIRNMYAAGEYPTALNAARETLQSDLQYVQREVIADLWRMVANLRWRERQFIKSFLAIVHAIIAWPAVSICLLEAVFRRLRRS
jgi:glycosyltransferase involved in cell wall biosynthesis